MALEWLLTKPISLDYPILRTPADWLVVGAWMSYCFFVAVRNTGDDYLHLTKAFGIVGVANFPLHFLLASKRSLLRHLLGVSYEGQINFLHRWLGRIITVLLSVHALLYLNFFYDTDRLTTRFLENDVQCGFWGYLLLTTISGSANHCIREWSYRLFYILHITLPSLLFPMLYFHVSQLRPYLWASIIIYTVDYTLRYLARTPGTMKIRRITPDLVSLSFAPKKPIYIPAGSHVLVNIPSLSSFASNPFSITTPVTITGSRKVEMVARVRSGVTKKLAAMHEGGNVDAVLEGPYGACTETASAGLLTGEFTKVLLVAGGIGGTFAASWVPALAKKLGNDKVKFVWAVKTADEAMWALEREEDEAEEDIAKSLEIYITGSQDELKNPEGENNDEGVELTTGLLAGTARKADVAEVFGKVGVKKECIKTGRPSVKSLIEQAVEGSGADGRTAVLVCGPARMCGVAKRAVADQGIKGKHVWIHVEEFGH